MRFLMIVLYVLLLPNLYAQSVLRELVKKAEESTARFQSDGAAWRMRQGMDNGGSLVIDVKRFQGVTRYTFRVPAPTAVQTVLTITDSEGFWFVDDGRTRRKYRPFEAPLVLPFAVYLMNTCEPRFVSAELLDLFEPDVAKDETRDVLEGRFRLTAALKQNLTQIHGKLVEFQDQLAAAGKEKDSEILQKIDLFKDALDHGMSVRIDKRTGVILKDGLPPKTQTIENFEWLTELAASDLEVEPSEWVDHSEGFSVDELKDVIQISWNPLWKVGSPSGDGDLMLLNVKTGKLRRAPFMYGIALGGCFSHDRREIFVTGTIPGDAGVSVFRINLLTGENSLAGDETLPSGIWLGAALSPDGQSLVTSQMMQGSALASQLHLIKLKTGEVRKLAGPLDAAFLTWHPDGKSILCAVRESVKESRIQKSWVTAVSLEGEVRRLREGAFPALLPVQQRILYEYGTDRHLETCQLDGSDPQPFGDRKLRLGFAAPSSDGRLVMMQFSKENAPQPCLIDVETFEAKPIKVPKGLWSRPMWR